MARTTAISMAHLGSGSRNSSAQSSLMLEFKSLQEEPVEGFRVKLVDDDNLFEWEVALFGPPQTLYEGGYFKATMKFPLDYPYSPPSVKFVTKVWHPNVYENGDLCISILHPPIDDPQSGELPCERWNPTQNVRTVMLSVISLLNEPNTYSPANVDASVMYRKWKESNGRDKEYENIIRKQVAATRQDAERDNVIVPTTLEEYCIKHQSSKTSDIDEFTDFYDDDYGDDLDYEDDNHINNQHSDLSDAFDLSTFQALLKTKEIGRPCLYMEEVSSTIDVAQSLEPNSLVVARTQLNGRGQRDRKWDSQSGCAMVSLRMEISQHSFAGQRISFLQHCIALAIARTLEDIDNAMLGPQHIRIKWPNDIMYVCNMSVPQKICGILVNMTPNEDTYSVICSFGLNVFNSEPTTCIVDILKKREDCTKPTLHGTIASIMNEFEDIVFNMNESNFEALKSSYMSRSLHQNQQFDHSTEGRVVITGIDNDGYLQARRLSDGLDCKLLSLE